jgi:toxic protein SymE
MGGYIYTMSTVKLGKRILTVYYTHLNGKNMPLIRLQGKWLQDLGFKTGSKIDVEETNGLLFIRVVPTSR